MANLSIQIQTVLYYNRQRDLERSLESIANAIELNKKNSGELKQFSVLYGDASSAPIFSENQIYWLKKKYEHLFHLEYHYFNLNTGTAKGHNFLGRDCQTDYIMCMNPDIILAPDFFIEIIRPFSDPLLKSGMSEARQTPIEHPKDYNKQTGETSWCSTAGIVIRADLFREVGGFDEDTFFMYCDDVDLSWRIRLLGYKCIYSPSAVVYHSKRIDAGANVETTDAELYYSAEAALLMSHKWSNRRRLKQLLFQMENSDDPVLRKAAAAFRSLEENMRLPEPVEKGHTVAQFIGDNYAKHRFVK